MKKSVIVALITLAILGGFLLFKNVIVKNLVSAGIKSITGLSLEIGGFDLGVFKPAVAIKDLKLFNPSGYEDKLMVDLPDFYADYDLAAFLKGKVHFRQLRINLKSLEVSRNSKGQLNLESLEALKPKGSGPAPEIKIDKLVLDIGKVSYKDYSRGSKPKISEFNLNIHQTYENIDNPQSLVKLILAKALVNTNIGDLAKFDLTSLKKELGNFSGQASNILEESAATARQATSEKIKGLFQGLIPEKIKTEIRVN